MQSVQNFAKIKCCINAQLSRCLVSLVKSENHQQNENNELSTNQKKGRRDESNSDTNYRNDSPIKTQAQLMDRLKKKKQAKMNSSRPSYGKILVTKSVQTANNQTSNVEDENELWKLENKYLKRDDIKPKREELEEQESAYLKQSSFKNRVENMDENGKKLLDEMSRLKKSSTDPRHLTIVHQHLAQKIAKIVLDRATKQDNSSIFVEFQPGFGLVTKSLLEIIDKNTTPQIIKKFFLIESFTKFEKYLKELSSTNSNVFTMRQRPFDSRFLYHIRRDDQETARFLNLVNQDPSNKELNLTVFGVLPWNSKGYLSKTFGDYASNRALFSLSPKRVKSTELLLYVPEILLARLKPDMKKHYSVATTSSLGVLNNLLTSKFELLDQQPCDYFFPYPIASSPNKYKNIYRKIDFKRLFLVSLRFDQTQAAKFENKRLLYLFVSQMFVRPTICLKDALKSVCTNPELVCKENSISPYVPVNSLQPFKFLKLFEYLVQNEELSMLSNLEHASRSSLKRSRRNLELKALGHINREYSGQFIVGEQQENNINNNRPENNKNPSTISHNEHRPVVSHALGHKVHLVDDLYENEDFNDFDDNDFDFEHTNKKEKHIGLNM